MASPWAVYEMFSVKDGGRIFLTAVSDAQWQAFCDAMATLICGPTPA